MVPFAGYSMPVHYAAGILAEHAQTRRAAGLFDVSHMGQVFLAGREAGKRLERLVPGDIQGLAVGRIRYTQFLDADGNILDDLMVARLPGGGSSVERFHLVVNAACKAADFGHLREHLPDLDLVLRDDVALLALQGPAAAAVLERHLPDVAGMAFMSIKDVEADGIAFRVARSGYTGEDGFEISVPAASAVAFAERLLAEPEVLPIGLGARDTLRLEAGLCLYGHDIDTTTTPIEAGLAWSIGKRRRLEGGFFGDERVRLQLAHRPTRRRVGLRLEGRAPAREGADISTPDGIIIGKVTSGGFGPTVGAPIAMGYVEAEFAAHGTPVHLMVRGKSLPARVADLPFVPHRYFRGA
jgi:aminomethyltransferase